jgi:hypothetical protein
MLNAHARGLLNLKPPARRPQTVFLPLPAIPHSASGPAPNPGPTSASMAVFGANVFQPFAVVAEEIPEPPGIGMKGEPQKGQVAAREVGMIPPCSYEALLSRSSRHHERPRIVVGGIALARVGHGEDGVLQHARVVGHGAADDRCSAPAGARSGPRARICARSSWLRGLGRKRALEARPLKARHVGPRRLRPRGSAGV